MTYEKDFSTFLFAWCLALVVVQPATAATPQACNAETIARTAPAGTSIIKATPIAATATEPEFCQVDAQVTTQGNSVNVRLRLPLTWNGKFMFHGVGGFAGSVEPNPPSATNMNSMLPGLLRGYAVASTDTGHQGPGTGVDASWALNNRAKEIDYGHRGAHAATLAGKALTKAYYGNPPSLSYFAGCSNGGRMAVMEAQRYPEDFDGIIAGAPALGTTGINRTLGYQVMLASTETYIPEAKLAAISKGVLAACDRLDGLVDGLVSNPSACSFKPETLHCRNGDSSDCLTTGQVNTLKKLYSGFSTTDGTMKTHGFPVGHESGPTGWASWIVGREPPERQSDGTLTFTGPGRPAGFAFQQQSMRYLNFENDQPDYDWRQFNVDRDAQRLRFMAEILRPTADLRAFKARGGKLLMYHGWSDPALSAYSTIDYLGQVAKVVGGEANADSFVRLFLAPGMHHCSGGPGPNSFVAEAIGALEPGWRRARHLSR